MPAMLQRVLVAAALVAASASADQAAHLHLRVAHKFYVTPLGQRCAFNNCVDPSVYPCQGGSCVRLNYSYGVCEAGSDDGSDDRPENEKFPCPYPNPYAEVEADSDSVDSDDVGTSGDEDDEYDEDVEDDEDA